MRSSRTRKILATTIAGVAIVALQASPANAQTTVTFTLSGTGVAVSTAPSSATLTGSGVTVAGILAGTATYSGQLGNVTVTDGRGSLLTGWAAKANASDFATDSDDALSVAGDAAGELIEDDNVTYSAGLATTSGIVTALTAGTAVVIAETSSVLNATAVAGNNTATWNPTVTIAVPVDSVAGTYSGTIVHSVA